MDTSATSRPAIRRDAPMRVITPNTLEANRKGRLPYIPGYCERRPRKALLPLARPSSVAETMLIVGMSPKTDRTIHRLG